MVKLSTITTVQKKRHSFLTIRAEDPQLQMVIRKAGMTAFKQRTHPQMWRTTKYGGAFARLGPMGALGDDLLFFVDIDMSKLTKLTQLGVKINITDLTREFKKDVLLPIQQYIINRINTKAPSRKGNLRKSLIKSLTNVGGSKDDRFPFIIIINTDGIEYAGPVNNMPSKNLQHAIDPEAEKGWYNFLILKGRSHSREIFNQFIQKIGNSLPKIGPLIGSKANNYTIIRSLFTTQYK